jgi:hypothetical protein
MRRICVVALVSILLILASPLVGQELKGGVGSKDQEAFKASGVPCSPPVLTAVNCAAQGKEEGTYMCRAMAGASVSGCFGIKTELACRQAKCRTQRVNTRG